MSTIRWKIACSLSEGGQGLESPPGGPSQSFSAGMETFQPFPKANFVDLIRVQLFRVVPQPVEREGPSTPSRPRCHFDSKCSFEVKLCAAKILNFEQSPLHERKDAAKKNFLPVLLLSLQKSLNYIFKWEQGCNMKLWSELGLLGIFKKCFCRLLTRQVSGRACYCGGVRWCGPRFCVVLPWGSRLVRAVGPWGTEVTWFAVILPATGTPLANSSANYLFSPGLPTPLPRSSCIFLREPPLQQKLP